MKWCNEEDIIIVDMIKNGKTYKDISNELGRTERSIRERLRKLGYKSSMFNKSHKICKNCQKEYQISIRNNQELNKSFCSASCSTIYNNKKRTKKEYVCLNCSKKIERKQKYCCNKCQVDYEYKKYIENWKNGIKDGISGKDATSIYIRKYLFEKYNNKCSICGWNKINTHTGKIPLTIEHKDGNWMNNKEENLDLLCPNCHSLTPTLMVV